MSAQSELFNPTETTSEITGNGLYICRITTARRLALSLGLDNKGLFVYDMDVANLFQWDGTQWLAASFGGGGGLYKGTTDPNGVLYAPEGSLYIDSTGPQLYYKASAVTSNLNWQLI